MKQAIFLIMLLFLFGCSHLSVENQKIEFRLGEIKTVTVGEESLNIELSKIASLEDKNELSALIKIDGTEIWMSEGQEITNDETTISLKLLKNDGAVLEFSFEKFK